MRSSIESVPYWVRVEKAKMEYRRREALKVIEKQKAKMCILLVCLETRMRCFTSQRKSQ